MQIYPLGEQSFKALREEGKVYIDKTRFIPMLLENKFYFLSRPRRFGKSLLLSTLECFFLGRRHLFEGLAIEKLSWDWEEFPVIRIDLTGADYYEEEGLKARFDAVFREYEERFQLQSGSGMPLPEQFRKLIKGASAKFGKQVVVLVDEYEKPLLEAPDDRILGRYRNLLSGIYSVIKSEGENIKFALLTGVTRFGHLNIFSGLNNLIDISLTDRYSAICGVTEDELQTTLQPGVERFALNNKMTLEEAFATLKKYYDGYHFSPELEDIYNPYSLMDCLSNARLASNWFQSGSSTYLIKKLRENHYNFTDLDDIKVGVAPLLGSDTSLNNPVTLLYQSGYLTIKEYDGIRDIYTLGIPNQEVREALYSAILPYYLGPNRIDRIKTLEFIDSLERGDANKAMEWMQSFFSSIPYDVKLDYENEFQQIVYSFFALVGMQTDTTLEKQTSQGRIDMVLEMAEFVYVFEFKLGEDAKKALEQINSKSYALQWQSDRRKVIKIGVAFSPKSRGISKYLIES